MTAAFQPAQSNMTASAPQLTLEVSEQPSKFHRFRYLKEVSNNRMGSILHSRSSAKTPVKVRVTAQSLTADCQLKLIGCTVFDDLTPHPFFLYGEDCKGGVFEKEFSISADTLTCDVSLDKTGIVCTPKKKTSSKPKNGHAREETEQDKDFQQRFERWNFYNKPQKQNQSKDVNQLRLAFQVFIQLPGSTEWRAADCKPVCSDLISDAKIFSQMTVDCVIPQAVSRVDQDVWLYMKDPLPFETCSRFKIALEDSRLGPLPDLPVKSVKKHLVVFNFDHSAVQFTGENGSLHIVQVVDTKENNKKGQQQQNPTGVPLKDTQIFSTGSRSLSVRVVDKETGDSSEPVDLQVDFQSQESSVPASKRRRGAERSVMVDSLDDLMEFVNQESLPDLQGFYVN